MNINQGAVVENFAMGTMVKLWVGPAPIYRSSNSHFTLSFEILLPANLTPVAVGHSIHQCSRQFIERFQQLISTVSLVGV
ncbi:MULTISPECIES: hypothetical protein [unclassified Pseudomonas]|uniref:hypothetical protein n=1 Tax=unclassified Pseudomonas TaxID=196821 RepID=UPI001E45247C|nr:MULTISPECIES: hypothetical protein [unclassified Pseudomonas]MDH1695987.1 hypothetical protein [Pseudomonas sp. GD03766]UFH29754.1 hypothetical protein LMH93_09970 [Pseudomonas sp. CIP-10]